MGQRQQPPSSGVGTTITVRAALTDQEVCPPGARITSARGSRAAHLLLGNSIRLSVVGSSRKLSLCGHWFFGFLGPCVVGIPGSRLGAPLEDEWLGMFAVASSCGFFGMQGDTQFLGDGSEERRDLVR